VCRLEGIEQTLGEFGASHQTLLELVRHENEKTRRGKLLAEDGKCGENSDTLRSAQAMLQERVEYLDKLIGDMADLWEQAHCASSEQQTALQERVGELEAALLTMARNHKKIAAQDVLTSSASKADIIANSPAVVPAESLRQTPQQKPPPSKHEGDKDFRLMLHHRLRSLEEAATALRNKKHLDDMEARCYPSSYRSASSEKNLASARQSSPTRSSHASSVHDPASVCSS